MPNEDAYILQLLGEMMRDACLSRSKVKQNLVGSLQTKLLKLRFDKHMHNSIWEDAFVFSGQRSMSKYHFVRKPCRQDTMQNVNIKVSIKSIGVLFLAGLSNVFI
jgi:hypothetical protein